MPGPPNARTRESAVVNQTKAVLKEFRAFFFKTHGGGYNPMPGLPDFIVCFHGRFIGLECKRPVGGVVSDRQRAVGAAIQAAGGDWHVVRSGDEVRAILQNVLAAA